MAPGPATTGEFCDKCFQTVLHQGQPSGTLGKVDGHDLYYALPDEGTYDKSVALLYCSDVSLELGGVVQGAVDAP